MILTRITFITLGLIFQSGLISGQSQRSPYYGTYIGKLDTTLHNVAGDVFSVDENTIFIKGFSYDGTAPDAYFWAGTTTNPDVTGFIVPDEKGSTKPLGAYTNKDIVLRLPEGKTFKDIKWFSVWCRKFKANFGHINVPRNLIIPTPVEIRPLSQLDHGVKSGPITIVDAQTFLINDFHYDGQGPAGYWWATAGSRQSSSGLRLKDENGSEKPLRRYSGETVVISLPEGKTIWDYDYIGVWCEEYQVDFGNTRIPQNIRVPPSPKMLGVKPESKLNCEVLYDQLGFELRWVMDGDDIVMQLVGKIEPNEYMAFGLSKDDSKSNMVGSDSVVTWFDSNGKGHAVDYYLGSKEQCVGTSGSCPDLKYSGASDSITLLHAALVNGFTLVTFKRPQLGVDDRFDQHVYSDGNQAVIWAIGPLNDRNEVSYHRLRSRSNIFIDFARTPKWNCPNSEASSPTTSSSTPSLSGSSSSTPSSTSSRTGTSSPPSAYPPRSPKPQSTVGSAVWDIPPVICPSDYTFRAQIGPVGGKKGYQGITGKVGWGIAWYINGLIVPELTVERGKTYTFIVEGGNDKVHSSRHHPLYITDSAEGGFDHKTREERSRERIFAGVGITKRGDLVPTAEGRLCEWKIDTRTREQPDDFKDFFDFQRTLSLQCSSGEPGVLRWKPDANTPDIVYYQCYTHRYLGWKIRVVDSCDQLASASITHIYHATADNSTRIGSSAQNLEIAPRRKAEKKQRKTGPSNRARGAIPPSTLPTNVTSNANVKNGTVRVRPKQQPSDAVNGDIRFRERKPVLSYASPYSPFPPRYVTPSLPVLYSSLPPNSPFGPIRPLDMHIGPIPPPPPPFNPNQMKRTPVYVRQRLPPPIPPTPPRSLAPKLNKLTTAPVARKKSTVAPTTKPTTVTTLAPLITKPMTTVSAKLVTTTKPNQVSSSSLPSSTTTTTKQPTSSDSSETGLAENLHGGFLPVLINSKGPTTVTTEQPRTTLDDLQSTKDSSSFFNRGFDLTRNPITGLPYYFTTSAANTTFSPIELNNLGYRPTSDQDKWENILLPVANMGSELTSGENIDASKLNSKETSTLDQVIMKMFNQSFGLGNIYPMLHGTDSSEENVSSGEDKKSTSSSEVFDPSSVDISSSPSFIPSSSIHPQQSNPSIIEKGLTGVPFNSKPIILPTSTVPINLFSSPIISSHPIIDYPFFSSFYPSHYGIAPSSSSSLPPSSSSQSSPSPSSSASSLAPSSSSVSISPSDSSSSQLSSYTETINQQSQSTNTFGDHQSQPETTTQPIDESFNSGPFDFFGSDGMTLSSSSSSSSSSSISSNGTDDAILSHIMSLIADNAAPPEVKIVSKSDGTSSSTHVEVHHNLSKRSAHDPDHHHNDGYDHDDDHHKQSSSSSSTILSSNSVSSGNKVFKYWSLVINSFITILTLTIFSN